MGSMGRIVNFKYTRFEMFILKSSVDDKIVDHTQYYVGDDNNNNLNEELSVDEVASDHKDLVKACRSCYKPVPTRPRTRRFILGNLAYDPEEGVEYFCSAQIIVNENKSRTEGVDLLGSTQMLVDEKNSSKSKKRSSDEDYVVSGNDYGEEESTKKKRQKKVEEKTEGPRKTVQVYNLPTEMPENLQEYIDGLNLEVPPMFVAQKLLTITDIKSDQGRLLLPTSLIYAEFFDNFLTEDEKELMRKTKPVEVNLVDNMMREYNSLHMTKWNMNSSSPYVLRKAWNSVVAENKLKIVGVLKDKKGEIIVGMEDDNKLVTDVVARVWSFRRESNIWFALNIQAMAEVKVLGRTEKGRYIIE